jgi:threonine/homoserine/homoserine lactone efflux protein
MMISESLFAFVGTAAILTVTPGLDTAMVLRTAAAEGAKHGIAAAIGIGIGCLCWGSAAAFGLGALLAASPTAFTILKYAGAAYLAWLGVNLLLRPRQVIAAASAPRIDSTHSVLPALKRGFVTNILTPKVGLFYITLLPQFVPHGVSVAPYSFLLACTHVALAVTWFIALATMTGFIRPYLQRPGVLPTLDRLTGGVFVLFGLQLSLGR